MPRLPRSLCICVAAACVVWLGEAVRLTSPPKKKHDANHTKSSHHYHHHKKHGERHPGRVVLVLRGEAFRGGRSGEQRVAMPEYVSVQTDNYLSQMQHVVRPFERLGMKVDVLTAMYETPYDHLINKTFQGRLKLLAHLPFQASDQGKNAVLNIEAYESYVNRTGTEYRFVVFARHDTRFLQDVTDRIFQQHDPDNTLFLYIRNKMNGSQPTLVRRCRDDRAWFEKDRSKIKWWCSDRFQVVPQKLMPAFHRLLNGSRVIPDAIRGGWEHGPRWPGECWGELGPLVGGDKHIDFFNEEVLALCKVTNDHSMPRNREEGNSTEAKLSRSPAAGLEDLEAEDLSYDWDRGSAMPLKWIKNCEEVRR